MATKRIEAREAHDRVESGGAILVCAYHDEEKFHKYHLQGAMSLSEFRAIEDTARNREVIFYCA